MDNSPLLLYKKAYDLHYKKKKLKQASLLYRDLIVNFPGTDLSNYASIQLSKIQATTINKTHSKTIPFGNIFVVVNLCLFLLVFIGLYSHIQKSKKEHDLYIKTFQCFNNLYAGNIQKTLTTLKELKRISQNEITPFELSANIYLKYRKFEKARNEYRIFHSLNPDDIISLEKIEDINKREEKYVDSLKLARKTGETQSDSEQKTSENPRSESNKGFKEIQPPLIDTDDVSYF